MRVILSLVIIALLFIVYLNYSYGRIYNHIKSFKQNNPNTEQRYLVISSQNLLMERPYQGAKRYVALGDSLTAGVGSDSHERTYPYIIAQKLTRPNENVLLINLGYPGATISDILNSQLPKAIEDKPHYVTILVGTNDVHNLVSPDKFYKNYQFLIQQLKKETSAKIVVFTIPYTGADSLFLPPFNYLLDFRIGQFNENIVKLAQVENVQLVDLYTLTRKIKDTNKGYYSSDLFHPSGEGYILWGRMIDAN